MIIHKNFGSCLFRVFIRYSVNWKQPFDSVFSVSYQFRRIRSWLFNLVNKNSLLRLRISLFFLGKDASFDWEFSHILSPFLLWTLILLFQPWSKVRRWCAFAWELLWGRKFLHWVPSWSLHWIYHYCLLFELRRLLFWRRLCILELSLGGVHLYFNNFLILFFLLPLLKTLSAWLYT